ncbi:WD40 repeat [Cryptosporidium xiaoi]|uniref:WD40 repeat n=1 Tax=Cryptosporidium xiaoi TaxID=659607 RepID=A0AAV9XVY5_9CRYT
MLVNVLKNRISAPETSLPIFNRSHSYLHNCLGHQSVIKIARQHDIERKDKICGIDWTCDGDKLVYCTRSEIYVMDPNKFIPFTTLSGKWLKGIPSKVNNYQLICASLNKPAIEFYDTRASLTKFEIDIPCEMLLNVAWSSDNRRIITGDKTDNLFLIDLRFPRPFNLHLPLEKKKEDYSINKSSDYKQSLLIQEGLSSNDKEYIDIGSNKQDKGINIVDILFEDVLKESPYSIVGNKKSTEEINDIIISSDNKNIIMARHDGKIEVISMDINNSNIINNDNDQFYSRNNTSSNINSCLVDDVSSSKSCIGGVDSLNDNNSNIFNDRINSNLTGTLFNMHLYGSTSVVESSNIIASFGYDQTISLFDLDRKTVTSTLNNIDGYISTMKFNNKNNEIFSVGITSEKRRNNDDPNDTLMLCNSELKILGRFDIPGRITSSSWHPNRNILIFSCNSLDNNNTNNTSSSNSGANTSSIHYNKIISSGLNGPNIPFVGFLTIE